MRVDQIHRVELFCAVVALVAARAVETAVRAGAFDITVRQVAAIGVAIHLGLGHFADQIVFRQLRREMLGQRVVLFARRPTKVIE